MSQKKHKKTIAGNILVQGGILAIAGLIARMIGLVRRIPLTNIIGDMGNGYYANAYEIYSIVLLLSSYSLPVAISRLVASRTEKGQIKNTQRYFRGALLFAVISGGLSCFLVFVFANPLASKIMGEPKSAMALRVLAPTLFIFAVMGAFRGYFQGFSNMVPTAVSQLIEQFINAGVSLWGAYILYDYGLQLSRARDDELLAPAWGAAGGTFGTVASVTAALLFMMILYSRFQTRFARAVRGDHSDHKESERFLYRILLLTILPIILSTLIYNISNVLDQGIFNAVLKGQGYTEKQYATIWGIYSGKFRVLMNVPLSLASSLGPAVVPSLTAAIAAGDRKAAVKTVHSSTRYTMIITIPCALGMGALGGPIIQMLFHPQSGVPLSAGILQAGVPVIILYALSTLTTAILQGLGRLREPLIHCAIALLVHIGALFFMLRYANLNIYAVMYANIIFALVICLLNALSIRRYIAYRQEWRKTFLVPLIASIIMAFAAYAVYRLLHMFLGNSVSTVAAILAGMIVYAISLVAFRGMTRSEIMKLPKGALIVRVFEKMGLLR